jgi:beta-galactosidase
MSLLESGKLEIPSIAPWTTVELPIPTDLSQYQDHAEEVFLAISFRLREATKWAPASHEVAWFQHKLSSERQPQELVDSSDATGDIDVKETRTEVSLSGSNWVLKFDRVRGYITRWSNGSELLEVDPATRAAIYPCFWRAPTDNDKDSAVKTWKDYGVHRMTSQLRSFQVQKDVKGGGVTVKTVTYLAPPVLGWGYNIRTDYRVSSKGVLSMKLDLTPKGSYPVDVPRVGLNLRLPKRLSQASWFGLGPGESYPDKMLAQSAGIWESAVDDLEVPYDVPQGNGNRMETRWVRLVDADGHGIRASRLDASTFNWTGSRLSDQSIEAAKHPCDLVREEATLLNLSPRVAGVGSATCGPGVRDDLLVKVEPITYEFVLESI